VTLAGPAKTPAQKLKALQARFPFRFRSSLSQHFLVDPRALERITTALNVGPGDCVLEVGAGAGFLTERLLQTGADVIAVEVDAAMVTLLKHQMGFSPRLKIVTADIMSLDVGLLLDEKGAATCVVAGNLPYHITTPALFHLLGLSHKPKTSHPSWRQRITRMVFTVQREVGLRMASGPGTKTYGALSVAVAYGSRCEKLFNIHAGAFIPRPKVDSVVVRLAPLPPRLTPEREQAFFSLMRAAFGQRRKMLLNAVAEVAGSKNAARALLGRAGLQETRRGETLSLEEFLHLASV